MRFRLASALAVMAVFAAGCSGEPAAVEESAVPETSIVAAAEAVRIATDGSYAPLSFVDDDGELVGQEIELAD